ncbi:MAG: HEAT repeat domain-containing protein [Planctomycetaceae bacterium]
MSSETQPPSSTPPSENLTSRAPLQGRAEELPPVTPPSAGYIIQLFLIPALIVAAVVAVWALFGKLADSETDWRQMVADLGSSNEHRRWRSALGLAQLLRNSDRAPVEGELPLSEQPIVIEGLTELLKQSLSGNATDDEDIRHQEFLARTLGSLDADDKVLPVLAIAMSKDQDIDVRKSALMAVAMIAGRHFEKATEFNPASEDSPVTAAERGLPLSRPTITDEQVLQQLRQAVQDEDPVIRHLAGFAVASVSGDDSIAMLKVMLDDADSKARANAAIGLARNGLTDGVDQLQALLASSGEAFDMSSVQSLSPEEQLMEKNRFEVEQPMIARNCLRAILELWPQIPSEKQAELSKLVDELARSHFAADVRAMAAETAKQINAP